MRVPEARAYATELATRLERFGDARAWAGTDPYEALNATVIPGPLRRSVMGRRLVIQAVKRSPLNLRPVLGIRPEANAASVAWAVSAYVRNGFLAPDVARERLRAAAALLMSLRQPAPELAFGYHFDFQSRVFFYPRGMPNTIATAFAGMALLDAAESLGDDELFEAACATGHFFLDCVPRTSADGGAYFGYLPGDRSPIHNSSLLAAALLARLAGTGSQRAGEMDDAARSALGWTLHHQRADGSWPYGEKHDLGWVDNFHTGYVLDAIRICLASGVGDADARESLVLGTRYFREHLVREDGAPKYYSTRLLPLDAQCVAQSIQTLSLAAGDDPDAGELAWRVLAFARGRMMRADGLPLFQRRRLWANRTPHMRWVVAPMLLALSHLLITDSHKNGVSAGVL